MHAAEGIARQRGGMTPPAAVVGMLAGFWVFSLPRLNSPSLARSLSLFLAHSHPCSCALSLPRSLSPSPPALFSLSLFASVGTLANSSNVDFGRICRSFRVYSQVTQYLVTQLLHGSVRLGEDIRA